MALRYTISFSDLSGRLVTVNVYGRDWQGGVTMLTGGASPLTLDEDTTEGIDTPCRAWTGVLTVLTEEGTDYSGLYADDVTSARVEVWRGGALTWQGYLVPEVMRQSWVAGEELSANVQSPLGALAGLTLDASGGFGYVRLGALLSDALALTGDWDTVTYPDDLSVGAGGTDTWLDVEASRMAFFTREYDEGEWDEAEQARIVYEGATGRAVVEAVARLTGWTARERGRSLWLTAESVSGYKQVSVAELGLPGRQVEDVAAPVMELDALTPAGTDHTVSLLRGYRRVRVRFSPDVVDDLLSDVLDPHNWAPTGEVAFEEDAEYRREVTVPGQPLPVKEDAGWFVAYYNSSGGFIERTNLPVIKYRFARYASGSVDGGASTKLYRVNRPDGSSIVIEDFAGEDDRNTWAYDGSDGKMYGWAGAEMVWLRYLQGMSWTEDPYYELSEVGQTSRKFGMLIWPSAFRRTYVDLTGEPIAFLTSPIVYMPYGALRLRIDFYGFLGAFYTDIMDKTTKVGPWSPTKYDSIKQWKFLLRFGNYYWDGVNWQTAYCSFVVDLDGAAENEKAEIMSSGRAYDESVYVDAEDGYIIPLRDVNGDDLPMYGAVTLAVYGPTVNRLVGVYDVPAFNPILLSGISLEVLRKSDYDDPYEGDSPGSDERTYQMQTGYKGAEDVYEVETRLGTWANDGCAMNILIKDGAPVEAFTSKRQGGKTGRPERLLLSTLGRLYGRARRQLEVEVDAADLSPAVTLTEGSTRYALTGLHWDVREGTARYVMEDFVPFA